MTNEERQELCDNLRSYEYTVYNQIAADEIKRLADERDQLVEQLAIRSETGMAKDMQEIMRINNELSERLALAQSDAGPDNDGVTRKDVESWMRYFDEHAEEFVAAHEAIIRRSTK